MLTGTAINAIHSARSTTMKSMLLDTSLTRQDFNRAITGFVRNIELQKEDFVCPNCGPTPAYIVADAKVGIFY